MKLVGSRTTGVWDQFSDYDYQVEFDADMPAVIDACTASLLWRRYSVGRTVVITGVDPQGIMFDYHGPQELCWPAYEPSTEAKLTSDFWIMSFKHLKALNRRLVLLLDVGLEISCNLARDIFVLRHRGTVEYKSFYTYRTLSLDSLPGIDTLFAATGMPTRTISERFAKVRALNHFVQSLGSQSCDSLVRAWEGQAAQLADKI